MAVEAIEAEQAKDAARRAAAAERKARQRAGQSRDSHATEAGQAEDTPSPKKETSPAPLKEKTTPSQSEPNGSSKTPRQALECVLDAEHAASVIDHRQRIRKPLTLKAAQLLAVEFAKCPDPNAGADAMVLNGWQGFDPKWMDRQQARGSPQSQNKPKYDPFKALAEELNDGQDRSQRSDFSDWDDAQGVPIRTIEHHR